MAKSKPKWLNNKFRPFPPHTQKFRPMDRKVCNGQLFTSIRVQRYIYICVCVCEVDLFRPFGMDPLKLGLGCRCPTTSVGHVTFGLGFEQDMSMRSVPFKTLKGR